MIGGRTGRGFVGVGDMAATREVADQAGDRSLTLEFGDAAEGLPPNPPKDPKDPDSRFEKLLLRFRDVLLDPVD